MRCAFHLHTPYSGDGRTEFSDFIRATKQLGIQALMITDHNAIDGAFRLRQALGERTATHVVIGEEIFTKEGEIIGLFLKQLIPRGLTVSETVRRIRDQQGVVVLPHPCDTRRPSTLTPRALEELMRHPQEVDAVEVFNGRTFGHRADRAALEMARAVGWKVIWGSDAHFAPEIGQCLFDTPEFQDAPSFLSALESAQPVLLQKTSLRQRVELRIAAAWGAFAPLPFPERVAMSCERMAFRAIGGSFLSPGEVDALCEKIIIQVRASGFRPEYVVGVLGSGRYPGRKIAAGLGLPFGAVRAGYKQLRAGRLDTDDMIGALFIRDRFLGNQPQLLQDVHPSWAGRRVLLVDDDCTTGRSLKLVLGSATSLKIETRTAVLRILSQGQYRPDFFAEDRSGVRLRNPRYPWIKYSPYYSAFWRFRRQHPDPAPGELDLRPLAGN